jgi:hypothetical protein
MNTHPKYNKFKIEDLKECYEILNNIKNRSNLLNQFISTIKNNINSIQNNKPLIYKNYAKCVNKNTAYNIYFELTPPSSLELGDEVLYKQKVWEVDEIDGDKLKLKIIRTNLNTNKDRVWERELHTNTVRKVINQIKIQNDKEQIA